MQSVPTVVTLIFKPYPRAIQPLRAYKLASRDLSLRLLRVNARNREDFTANRTRFVLTVQRYQT